MCVNAITLYGSIMYARSTGDALLPFLEAELRNLIMLDILISSTLLGFNCNYIT
jgi:hypothetical protein